MRVNFKTIVVGILCAVLTPVILTSFFSSSSAVLTLNQMGIAIILAVSYNLLLGKAKLLSLGHAAYFGFGGFFAVHVALYFAAEGNSWLTAPLIPLFSGTMGLLGAIILGSFTTKRGGLIFAMLSFAMAELVLSSSTVFGRFYGGSIDRTEIPAFLGENFQSDSAVFYLVWIWVLIVIGISAWFSASPIGRMAKAVGENPDRVEYVGYDQQKLKYLTFCLSGFLAGIGGGLFALTYEFVTVEIISLQQSWLILQMVFIGGTGFFWGPPLGAILLTLVFSGLSGQSDLWNLYAGVVFILIVLFAPNGITGIVQNTITKTRNSADSKSIIQLYCSHTAGIILTLAGFIGLCEMTYFLRSPISNTVEMSLYGMNFNPTHIEYWFLFGFILITGGGVLRMTTRKLPN